MKNPQGSHPQYSLKSIHTVKIYLFLKRNKHIKKIKKKCKPKIRCAMSMLILPAPQRVCLCARCGLSSGVSRWKVTQHRQHRAPSGPSFPTKPEMMAFLTVPHEKNTWTLNVLLKQKSKLKKKTSTQDKVLLLSLDRFVANYSVGNIFYLNFTDSRVKYLRQESVTFSKNTNAGDSVWSPRWSTSARDVSQEARLIRTGAKTHGISWVDNIQPMAFVQMPFLVKTLRLLTFNLCFW